MPADKFLIDGHKLYWHIDRVVEWQKDRLIPPIYIEVSPISTCNHQCVFCGIDFVRGQGDNLNSEVFYTRLREMGKIGVRSMMFAGEGEPLLHKDIRLFIRTAKEYGIDVSMTTNGSLGNYELWKDILPHLTWLRFSIDAGTPEVYSKVHGVSMSSFERTINSIKDALAVKKELQLNVTIGVQYLIIGENLNDIENALGLFSGIKMDYFSLKPFSFNPKMLKKRDELYTAGTIEHIRQIVDSYNGILGMSIVFREDAMGKYMCREQLFEHCYALPFGGYISSKGDFYTCKEFIGDERFKTGNIYEDDMEKVFFGEQRMKSIRYGEKELTIGAECRTNCRMARINEFLGFLEKKPEHINFI